MVGAMLTVEDVMGEVLSGPVNVVAGTERMGTDVICKKALVNAHVMAKVTNGKYLTYNSLRHLDCKREAEGEK